MANPVIRRVRRLRKREGRERERLFLVEGHRAVSAALDSSAVLEELFFTPRAAANRRRVLVDARDAGLRSYEVSRDVMAHLTSLDTTPDVLAVAPMRPGSLIELRRSHAIVLDGVRDPAAAGGVLAAAAAAGVGAAVAVGTTVDLFDPKVVRAANGAHFTMSLARAAAEEVRDRAGAAGLRIVAVGESGAEPWKVDLAGAVLWIEGVGERVDAAARVGFPGTSVEPSVAARAAAVLSELVRQRSAP